MINGPGSFMAGFLMKVGKEKIRNPFTKSYEGEKETQEAKEARKPKRIITQLHVTI